MKKFTYLIILLLFLFGCDNQSRLDSYKKDKERTIDSLQHLLNTERATKVYYETGWTLVKINGTLDTESKDSICQFGTFGLFRIFDESASGLTYKIQDIELNGGCTSFEPGRKLYIISKTPF